MSLLLAALTTASLFIFSASDAKAQNKGLGEGRDAKKLVDETNAYEAAQRAELQKKIAEQQRKTIANLRRLAQKYKDAGDRGEAREIRKAIEELEEKVGGRETTIKEAEPESDIFVYGKVYLFKSGKINGRITFMANGKANAIFKLQDDAKNVIWEFAEKGDHVYIKDAGVLGKVYISEVPKSEKRSIMIRLGGKLRHEVITASFKN